MAHEHAEDDVECARNSGLMKSTGNYVLFVDADDYLVPELPLFFEVLKRNS